MKAIAVDIDDTLNNFTNTLKATNFTYDKDKYNFIDKETFDKYIELIKAGEIVAGNNFHSLWDKIHSEIYKLAKPRPGAAEFIQELKAQGWTICILTYRDLRTALETTHKWLKDNNIPFDYLFNANDKAVFCRLWDIKYLIDDNPYNVVIGPQLGLKVAYYRMEKHNDISKATATQFKHFKELSQWIS